MKLKKISYAKLLLKNKIYDLKKLIDQIQDELDCIESDIEALSL